MYQVVAADGSILRQAPDITEALALLRTTPRAQQVLLDGILLAFKPRSALLAMVGYGADAGAPRGIDSAYVAGASGWN